MENYFEEGYNYARRGIVAQKGACIGDGYIRRINIEIQIFNTDINRYAGYRIGDGQLQGFIAEVWHGDTLNINATVEDSAYRVKVLGSNRYASPDIVGNGWSKTYSLKYYKSAKGSADAQAKSGIKPQVTSELGDSSNANNSMYAGQMRLIPVEQYNAIVEYLEKRIAEAYRMCPDQAGRYEETLAMLTTKVEAPDGTCSVELTREASEVLARIAKEGKFDASNYGFSTERLIRFRHVLKQGVKAGTTAAVIAFVLKTAPEFYKCIEKLIGEGHIDEEELRQVGFTVLNGFGEGFLQGFIAGTLTTACESGIWGSCLKNLSPSSMAVLTVVLYQTMKDSYLVVKGDMTQRELVANISKNIFITSWGIGMAVTLQSLMPMLPLAYMLGNFVGTFIGAFVYVTVDNAVVSLAVHSGWTIFGLVEQDYTLPEEVMREIGVDVFDYDKYNFNSFDYDTYHPDYFCMDEYQPQFIRLIRRGVIGVQQVGYRYS